MSIASIISAIGNNSSIYPLLVRDCGIEVPTKIALTYKQNKEDKKIAWLAARERFIDEYAVSAVWLGGIPLIDKISKSLIKKAKNLGLNSDVNTKLFKEETFQGLEYNISKFKNIQQAQEAVKDLINVKNNKELFKKLNVSKFAAAIVIPIALMGFVIPKLIFASTAKKMEKYKNSLKPPVMSLTFGQKNFETFVNSKKSKNTSFKGGMADFVTNLRIVDKMAMTDGGYAVGRVVTARKKNEAIDLAFKMSGMMFLNFVAPNWIKSLFDKISKVKLDPLMLADKEFVNAVVNQTLKLPESSSAKELLEFIDKNPDSLFVKYANKFEKIKLLKDTNIRDPRAYVNVEKLAEFRNEISDFTKKALSKAKIKSYLKKAKWLKSTTVLANIGLSSFLLAYCLPKAQFAFRKFVTGSKLEPGLIDAPKKNA